VGSIKLDNVEKWFADVQVIKGLSIDIEHGEFIVFVGPSGCGKSTLLRMIAGLEDTSRGTIWLDGEDVTAEPPSGRKLSMVFQSYALYPHMSVRENMGFGLKTAGVSATEISNKVAHAASILELEPYLERRPKDLSGGQRQRVAIGRAIVREPKGFLFDEPLSNLDAALRVQMRFEIAKLHDTLNTTMIYVTHDQVEAMTLADRIVVLKDGLIMQTGSPAALYEKPDNLFVAQFIGSPKMNIVECEVTGKSFNLAGHAGGQHQLAGVAENAMRLGIRPEHISVVSPDAGHCCGVITFAEYLGADTFLYVACENLGTILVRCGDTSCVKGETTGLHFDSDKMHFFDQSDKVLR